MMERCEHGNVAAYCMHYHAEPTDEIGTLICHRCGSVVKYADGAGEFRERFFNFGAEHGEGKCEEMGR